jgi:hypothetical protein
MRLLAPGPGMAARHVPRMSGNPTGVRSGKRLFLNFSCKLRSRQAAINLALPQFI